ncbi:hypothetical protein Pmani_009784 [Petrolisthes manimaculis]|uniref:Uncharacterized protein n=1 Tax=Petrolisthes manimaculis TaxID=1843537 RepID=A0AAE1Q4B3_9EUCA|nr:hypothetical protein Pmani_009784 [Petrolisthes manimaculis]
MAPELFDTPDLHHEDDSANLTRLLDGAVPLSPGTTLQDIPGNIVDAEDIIIPGKSDAKFMAYLLIGACCGLALLSITGVIVIVRFKKTCGSRQIKTRTRLTDQGSVESITQRTENMTLAGESGHKLGSWFTGRNEHLGSGKLRSNMALPDVHDHRRGRGGHTGSTRDLLSLSSQSSRSSTPRQPETPNHTEGEEPRASWLHDEYRGGAGQDPATPGSAHRHGYSAESQHVAQKSVRERRYTGSSRHEAEQLHHSSSRHNPQYLTSMDSEDLESHLEGRRDQTDSELEDMTTQYDEDESRDPSRYCSDSRELDDMVEPSMTSQELGEHLSRDLRQYQSRQALTESQSQSESGLRRSHSQVSFSRDTVQNEVFLELDNILRQHAHYPSTDPAPSTLGRASRATDHTRLSISRANTPDSIDLPHPPPSPPTTPPRFSPPPAPPRPPKPGHLSQPGTPSPPSERARPPSPGSSPNTSSQRPVYWTSEEERLI